MHGQRYNFSPKSDHTTRQPVAFPPPPDAALQDPTAADEWFDQALDKADEPLYHAAPGMPRHGANDAQVFAMACEARPTSKHWIQTIFQATGRFRHLTDDRPVSRTAEALLRRLVALLNAERCNQGWFHVTACNATLAKEMEVEERAIRRNLALLQQAGFLYRHYTTGEVGLKRHSIDLGPLIYRLDELASNIQQKAEDRLAVREARTHSLTFSNKILEQQMTGGEDKFVPLNTTESESLTDSVSAQGESVVGRAREQRREPVEKRANFAPTGRPEFVPKSEFVAEMCPNLAAYVRSPVKNWSDLIDAAYVLSENWGMNRATWKSLCANLGREWTAITIAVVAELPAARFTRSNAPSLELKRARYVSGIARKIHKEEEISVAASWLKHVKLQQAESLKKIARRTNSDPDNKR